MSQDFFIKESVINAYTINAFAEALVEATKQGLELDYDSARRIGASFSINIAQSSGETVETQEAPAVAEEKSEAPSADKSDEQSEEESASRSEGSVEDTPAEPSDEAETAPYPTPEQIEAAQDSMKELEELGKPFGIQDRSKKGYAKQLRELIGE